MEDQTQEHRREVLPAGGTSGIDSDLEQVQLIKGIQDEVAQGVSRNPIGIPSEPLAGDGESVDSG